MTGDLEFLDALGVVEEPPVGWVAERSPGWLSVGLVIARCGGAVAVVPRRDATPASGSA
ncbi:hypothetical protein [Nocardia wallacei]|uniref:hypothetical protein n=1 Tax=Nocardia wallacei TaxID=480035 RepID=UPI0024549803|nr:hypothetical protein [Nocardia wallacei]